LTGDAEVMGAESVATFDQGRAIFIDFTRPMGEFSEDDVDTWDFKSDLSNVIAQYDLAPRDTVLKGTGEEPATGGSVAAGQTNRSVVNALDPSLNQGFLLFDFAGNGDALPDPPNDQFQVNGSTPAAMPDLFGDPGTEGLFVTANQETPVNLDDFDMSDEDILNDIMDALLSGEDFSTAFTFDPTMSPGDLALQLSLVAKPTSSSGVPEPATALMGLMGLAGLALRRRRQTA